MFRLYHLTENIIYFKILFKNVSSLNFNKNKNSMKLFLQYHIFTKNVDYNENIILNNISIEYFIKS
jgi:hypothetical protein